MINNRNVCFQSKKRIKELDIFESLQKFNGIEIPKCIKEILQFAAYDTAASLALITDTHVQEIEKFINESDKHVINQLSCCYSSVYQGMGHFKFLPGHKCTILAIPSQIARMKNNKPNRTQRLLEFKKLLTKAELADLLLKRLNQYFKKSDATNMISFSEAHLGEITILITENAMTAKCQVSCVLWNISNIVRHVKQHRSHLEREPFRSQNETTQDEEGKIKILMYSF